MIAIISDVHGNYEALKKVLEEIDRLNISEIFCLGDVVGYYSQVNECCDEMRKRNIRCVMGNHDWYFASGSYCERSKSVNDCLSYQQKIITPENRKWIESFPVIIKAYGISMVHGGWINPIDEYVEPCESYFKKLSGKIFVSGHTHRQMICKYSDKIYCNPGSVGQPRDGNTKAAFAVFDGNDFELYRVEYDIQKVGQLMEKAGFSSYYYGCLRDASLHLHV